MQKRLLFLCILVLVSGFVQGYTDAENYFIDLLNAAERVDSIFSGRMTSSSGSVFSTNASADLRQMAKAAVDRFMSLVAGAKGSRLLAELDSVTKSPVLANWRGAEAYNWVTKGDARPEAKRAITDIMAAYTSSKPRVLTNMVGRLISDDYLALRELAEKIDKDFAAGSFGLNVDESIKLKLATNIQLFVAMCDDFTGLAAPALKNLPKAELFGLWKMATETTGWLDVTRSGWQAFKTDKKNAAAVAQITPAVGRLMSLYAKDKGLLVGMLNKIFVMVRDLLAREAAVRGIKAREDDLIAQKSALSEEEKSALLEKARELDAKLGKISMNASYAQKIAADDAVDEFQKQCNQSSSDAIKALVEHPLLTSWTAVKKIDGWFDRNLADKTVFEAWKKEYPKSYKAFGPASVFMDLYGNAKSPKPVAQNLVKSVISQLTGGDVNKTLEKLSRDKAELRTQISKLKDSLDVWRAPAYTLPEASRIETTGKEETPEIDLFAAAKAVDEALGVINMNSSYENKQRAEAAVEAFKDACYAITSGGKEITKLLDHPVLKSWAAVKEIEGWFDAGRDYGISIDAWKQDRNLYGQFGKAATFMSASKTALQDAARKAIADRRKSLSGELGSGEEGRRIESEPITNFAGALHLLTV